MKSAKKLFRNKSLLENKILSKSQINLFKQFLTPNLHIKEEILFTNKSRKELLLSQIKETQISLLPIKNKTSLIISKNKKIKILKNILYQLKQNLSSMLKEKQLNANVLENKLNNIKKKLQKKIFSKEKMEINYGKNELSKLKILNFKIENEIEKINYEINNKEDTNKYLKILNIMPEDNREIFYTQKKTSKEIDQIFYNKNMEEKEKINQIVIKKNLQNSMIDQYQKEINKIKQMIELNKIINPSDIIFEDSLENKFINSFSNYYNSSINNNKYNNSFSENNECDDNMNKISDSININNKNKKNVISLKMNINFNINFNKYISNVVPFKENIDHLNYKL